ncbi:fungal-specific transcription factor domain-containing protein [Ilyonectria sp. MPI-CAGE-AT-0026]|nr:fungal-specific transcription factor domain-containing protein [Ilyonectria sp. MPI-CAGE-AT-0026]
MADTIISAWNTAGEEQGQQQASERETQPRNPPQPRRVCAACRRRKVGCDKKQPCQHCKKSGTECVYPPEGESAARQVFADAQLWEQLHRLEPMFKTLADRMEQGFLFPSSSSGSSSTTLSQDPRPGPKNARNPAPTPPAAPQSVGSASTSTGHRQGQHASDHRIDNGRATTQQVPTPLGEQSPPQDTDSLAGPPSSAGVPALGGEGVQGNAALAWSPYGTMTGKLVKDDGRRRFVSGTFWEALHTENDMDETVVTDDESDNEDQAPSSSGPESSHYALIFNSCAQEADIYSLHLPHEHRLRAWQLFNANVHPVATILHIPSVEPMILEAIQHPQNLTPPLEALMFVVYFGAANSLSADDCELQFGSEQSALLARFRRGADNALARSRLMETDDILTLQTFVVYLVLLRSHDPNYSWNMTGLAVRLAQSLGMHRDGSTLNLSLFDAEMRRRLWWSICILDTPASEDYSCSPGLMELSSFTSRPPLNVNDSDLHPSMTEYPSESKGMTDMSFTVVRCWASDTWRTMIDTRRTDLDTGKSYMSMTTAEKEAWVDKQREKITNRLLGDIASREPLYCLTSAFISTIIGNLRLLVFNPLGSGVSLTKEQRSRVFRDAVDCMAHSYRLRTDPRVTQWAWLTRCYNEWHAFAIILSELCNQPLTRDADKAWRVVEQSAVLRWDLSIRHRQVHQWRSVMRSIEKARRRRKKELGRRRSSSSAQPASISSSSSRRAPPPRERFWPPGMARHGMSYSQSNQGHIGLLHSPGDHGQGIQESIYQTDESMVPLIEAEELYNFDSEDAQLYF